MTNDRPVPRALDEEFPLWLAACDEQLAAGAQAVSPVSLGAPAELVERLDREAAWCQMVRRMWTPAASSLRDRTACPADDCEPNSEASAQTFGRFMVRQELGRGAFGVVSLAYDPHLRREVALKVPRDEVVVTPHLRARFRREAMAAAGLDHPNIVPVYDAGEEGSVCFIASAYCPGITLAAWLRQRTAPVPYRMAAEFVATLAGAVEHAHRRGVLHRDLKPSNVLLEEPTPGAAGDDRSELVPRVTDFGLAKLQDPVPGEDAANATLSGVIMGTPRYMAPEQAVGNLSQIGPAADIYSLGVILYEMLTGRTPFQGESGLDTLVQVRSQDPLPPSRLRPRLPRDLETICLKCLKKVPQARYLSAQALADDLHRFLAALPIRARPTSVRERAIKWVRRHPVQAVAATAAASTAIIVAATIGMANVRLERERDRAELRRREAVANLRKARDAVDRMLTRVSEKRLRDIPQVEPVQRALLEDALEFHRDFARQAPDDPEIQAEASRAFRRLARTYCGLRRGDEAMRLIQEAIALQRKLVAADPTVAAYRSGLGEALTDLGLIAYSQRQFVEAVNATQNALALFEEIIAANPSGPQYRPERAHAHNIRGMALDGTDRLQAAEDDYRKTIALLEEQAVVFPADTASLNKAGVVRNNLGVTLENQGRLTEAEALFRQNLEDWEKLSAGDASNSNYRSKQALALDNLASVWEKSGRKPEAEQALRRSVSLRSNLTKEFPNTPHYLSELGDEVGRLANLVSDRGDLREARRLQQQVIVHRQALLALVPKDTASLERAREGYTALIETLIRLGAHDDAAKMIGELMVLPPESGRDPVRAAAFLARCVPLAAADRKLTDVRRAEQARIYADRAVALLREVIKVGHLDFETLKTDHDFDVLKSHDDFRQLFANSVASKAQRNP